MYGYQEEKTIKDYIIQCDQLKIFELIFQEELNINNLYVSPFRNDRNPKCKFEWYNNILYFVDFADIKITRNCLDALIEYYSISVSEAIKIIKSDSLTQLPNSYIKYNIHNQDNIPYKQYKPIYYKTRNWEERDKLFWSSYHIKSKQLIDDKVYPILAYSIYSKFQQEYITIVPDDITYIYTDFEKGVKIYRPFSDKYKWTTNLTKNDIGFINKLDYSNSKLLITKSYKDARILKNCGITNIIWFQNEGMIPSNQILEVLVSKFKTIYILFDNDNTGLTSSAKLCEILQSLSPLKPINVSFKDHYNIKDSGDFVKTYSLQKLKSFIKKQTNLLQK